MHMTIKTIVNRYTRKGKDADTGKKKKPAKATEKTEKTE